MTTAVTVPDVPEPTDAPTGVPRVDDYCDVNFFDPFPDGFPHAEVDKLRAAAPVAWADEEHANSMMLQSAEFTGYTPGPGAWIVTSHAAVTEVSRNTDLFSSWIRTTNLLTPPEPSLTMMRQMMLNMDGADHNRLRRILQPLFTPRAVQRLQDAIDRNAVEIADTIDADRCDLVPNVSAEMPLRVLADLFGMPREDRHLIFDWSNKLIGMDDPEYGGDLSAAMAAIAELFAYGKAQADDRRETPRDDLVSLIANAEVDGERLDDVEFAMFWLLLVIAGNETTRNTLSASVIALVEQDQWGWLRDNPQHIDTAIEELIRFTSAVIHFRRTATCDVELEGQNIRAGDRVAIWYSAANRDPAVFPNPNVLDLTRDPNRHVGFGVGPHFCLGAHLARMQLRTMLAELLRRFETVSITGDVERVHSNFIAGIRHLPLSLSPAA